MSLQMKNVPVFVNNVDQAIGFFNILGFNADQKRDAPAELPHTVLINHNSYVSVSILPKKVSRQKTVVLHTDDCLRDYHLLRTSGIRLISEPEYTDIGMTVKCIDFEGNDYLLIEERDYNDI